MEYSPSGIFNSLMLVVTKGHSYILKQNLEDLVEGFFNMYDKKRDREIEHTNLLIYLER